MTARAGHEYPILEVDPDSQFLSEPMGTKRKFWCHDEHHERWLFKYSRAGTGEHWSEKVASAIAGLLEIPAAHVELARCRNEAGCASKSFLAADMELVHGNEILQQVDESYPVLQLGPVSKHTVRAVLSRLEPVAPSGKFEAPMTTAADEMVGYLLLDALILNTDRHHENWGVIVARGAMPRLAPSYDHASSLGRELLDDERTARLHGRDRRRTLDAYVERARSALFRGEQDAKPLHPVAAFEDAAAQRPAAGAFWLERLGRVGQDEIASVMSALPASMVSDVAREFATAVLVSTRARLLTKGTA